MDENYGGTEIASSPQTISFKIKDKTKASFVSLYTNSGDFTAHHDIKGIIPTIPPLPNTEPKKYIVSLNGIPYKTRGYWDHGRQFTDFMCHSEAPEGSTIIVLATSNKNVHARISAHCNNVANNYCDSYGEFCVNYWFNEACIVNDEWINWYKEYCQEHKLPYNEVALCQPQGE